MARRGKNLLHSNTRVSRGERVRHSGGGQGQNNQRQPASSQNWEESSDEEDDTNTQSGPGGGPVMEITTARNMGEGGTGATSTQRKQSENSKGGVEEEGGTISEVTVNSHHMGMDEKTFQNFETVRESLAVYCINKKLWPRKQFVTSVTELYFGSSFQVRFYQMLKDHSSMFHILDDEASAKKWWEKYADMVVRKLNEKRSNCCGTMRKAFVGKSAHHTQDVTMYDLTNLFLLNPSCTQGHGRRVPNIGKHQGEKKKQGGFL